MDTPYSLDKQRIVSLSLSPKIGAVSAKKLKYIKVEVRNFEYMFLLHRK